MNDADDPGDGPPDELDREAVLRRRSDFIALALAGLASAAMGCGPQVCLSPPCRVEDGCGGPIRMDGGPDPDGGRDAGRDAGSILIRDAGGEDAAADDAGEDAAVVDDAGPVDAG